MKWYGGVGGLYVVVSLLSDIVLHEGSGRSNWHQLLLRNGFMIEAIQVLLICIRFKRHWLSFTVIYHYLGLNKNFFI